MTLKVSSLSPLIVTISIFIVQHSKCNVQNHQDHTEHHRASNHTVPPSFDLSRVKNLSRSELEANFHSIVLTMRKEGRNVLKYFSSDLLDLIFSNHNNEPEHVILERWHAQCDFFLDNEDIDHFESYVLSHDDKFIDGSPHEKKVQEVPAPAYGT